MSFICLGDINKNQIPILIGCIFCFLNRIVNKYFRNIITNNMVTNIATAFSRFLAVIPFIILKVKSKQPDNKENKTKNNNGVIEYLFSGNTGQYVKGKYIYIIFASIVYSIQSFLFGPTCNLKTNTWSLYILIIPIFYYFIFKIKLYKHHVLCIVIILLLGVIISFFT